MPPPIPTITVSTTYDNPLPVDLTTEQLAAPQAPRRLSRDQGVQVTNISVLPDLFGDSRVADCPTWQEPVPRLENYRNASSIHRVASRPTLDELHEPETPELNRRKFSLVSLKVPNTLQTAIKFGWFQGVYIRCLLNTWGSLLFLRMGWMTAQAGIGLSIIIILVSTLVTVLTTLSMSAICTNGEVRGGGAYYMISRSLGPEFGGSIGIIFTVANVFAVAMYLIGAAETVSNILNIYHTGIVEVPSSTNDMRIVGIIFLVVSQIITFAGMAVENKTQNLFLFVLLVSIADYLVGSCLPPTLEQQAKGFLGWSLDLAYQNFGPNFRGETFFTVFSIFFPSVIGILAGANISGDLRDPSSALPKGTMWSIVTSSGTYLLIVIWLGFTMAKNATGRVRDVIHGTYLNCTNRDCDQGMQNNYQVMVLSAGLPALIYAGIFAASLSSALSTILSAPRVFQALCRDKIIPFIAFFEKGYGRNDDPRRASVLFFILCLACTLIGNLNAIAPFISNFYMATFLLINFACFHVAYVKSPGFRPGFKYFNMWVSLFGAILCLVVMFIMDWWTALATNLVVLLLYIVLQKRNLNINWGSSTQGAIYKEALSAVTKLNKVEEHVKNYRPAVLVLTGNCSSRPPLVDLTHQMTKNVGFMICGHAVQGPLTDALRKAVKEHNTTWLQKRKVKGFYSMIETNSFAEGAKSMLQLSGLGKLHPNIVVMGFSNKWTESSSHNIQEYMNIIHHVFDFHLSMVILRLRKGLEMKVFFENENGVPYGDVAATTTILRQKLQEDQTSQIAIETNINMIPNGNEPNGIPSPIAGLRPRKPSIISETLVRFRRISSAVLGRTPVQDIPYEILSNINQFQKMQKGTIDVWWLYDDGGLTLLIPYLLSTRSQWQQCKLRVFSVAKNASDLGKAQVSMASLINKFRIQYSDVTVLSDSDVVPNEAATKHFQSVLQRWVAMEGADAIKGSLSVTKDDLLAHAEKTKKYLRLRELLIQHSKDAALIVLTLPMPRKSSFPATLYLAWLDLLTYDMPPFLLVRGNQTNVLTFYC